MHAAPLLKFVHSILTTWYYYYLFLPSGGERSFTTLSLLLALGESLETPFRVMDEFDVFLDPMSRKIALETMVRRSRTVLELATFRIDDDIDVHFFVIIVYRSQLLNRWSIGSLSLSLLRICLVCRRIPSWRLFSWNHLSALNWQDVHLSKLWTLPLRLDWIHSYPFFLLTCICDSIIFSRLFFFLSPYKWYYCFTIYWIIIKLFLVPSMVGVSSGH